MWIDFRSFSTPMLCFFALILSTFATTAYCRIYSAVSELPEDVDYDFIIVGGGTAGCVLANRLSANSRVNVLVIEAGSTPDSALNVEVPFFAPFLKGSEFDWNFTSVAQPALNNRTVYYERGHALGGSSVVNLLAFNRGSNDFWDHWATLTNDSQWSWENIEPYYLMTSKLANPHSGLIPSAHGDGPVPVSTPGFETILNQPVIDTAKLIGGRFSFQTDWNAGNFTGIGYYQGAIGNGQRSDAASAYITPSVANRQNLDILLNTRVTQLIQTAEVSGKPAFLGVKFGTNASDLRTLTASAEVILSAGVFGTAQILMLSGIGPSAELESLGITPLVDAPQVGGNLTDHPLLPNYFYINGTTFDPLISNLTARTLALAEWNATRKGRLVDANAVALGFLRLPESPALAPYGDPSSGPLSANIELLFADGFSAVSSLAHPTAGTFVTILTAVVSPLSRGSVTLASSDPFAAPIIDTQLLSHPFDQAAMAQAMVDAETLLASPLLAVFNPSPYGTLQGAEDFDSRVAYARSLTTTLNHPVGTAAMSPTSASWGVLDSNLLVKKVSGLRVVDASAFPAIPECHPQAVVYTLAQRAATIIEESWKEEHSN